LIATLQYRLGIKHAVLRNSFHGRLNAVVPLFNLKILGMTLNFNRWWCCSSTVAGNCHGITVMLYFSPIIIPWYTFAPIGDACLPAWHGSSYASNPCSGRRSSSDM